MSATESPYEFDLPVAFCYACKRDVVVYRDLPEGSEEGAPLGFFCVECDARLDRWGMRPEVRERPFAEVKELGYAVLDERRRPGGGCGPGGCARS